MRAKVIDISDRNLQRNNTMSRPPVTSHILNTATGEPAKGVLVEIFKQDDNKEFVKIGQGSTNLDGRVPDLLAVDHNLEAGTYRCVFATEDYYKMRGEESFYPSVQIDFFVRDPTQHYHIPLLLSPFGYSTYRGS